MRQWPEAIASYRAEIAGIEDSKKRDANNILYPDWLRVAEAGLAECYAAQAQWNSAAQAMQSALDNLQEIASQRTLRADEEQAKIDGIAKLAAWKLK